jgi:hypothetical protein
MMSIRFKPDGRGWHIKGDLIPLIFSLKARKL